MFSVITNIYNKKTKGPTLMEFFTATGKLKKFFFHNQSCSMCAPRVTRHASMLYSHYIHTIFLPHTLTRVWQELEYRIDACRVTRGALIEYLQLKKKKNQFSCGCEKFHYGRSFGFLVINVCNDGVHYETPCIFGSGTYETTDMILAFFHYSYGVYAGKV